MRLNFFDFCFCALIAIATASVIAETVVVDKEKTMITFEDYARNQQIRDGQCGDNLSWTINESGTLIISGTGKMNNYSFTDTPWKSNASSITSIEIKEGVESIGNYAFCYCKEVRQVVLPSGLKSVGDYAFDGCGSLTQLTIPSSVTSIGDNIFFNCDRLKDIYVEPGNSKYESIDGILFDYQSHTLVKYPPGRSDSNAYMIPDGILTVGEHAFSQCSFLSEIVVSSTVETIGDYAFVMCTYLESITFPSSSLKYIGRQAFNYCSRLTTITLPASLTSIEPSVFDVCPNLAKIDVEEGNTKYSSIDGVLFDISSNTLVYHPIGKKGPSYTIPSFVTSIGKWAFRQSQLTEIIIPSSVRSIQERAFSYCRNLSSIYIPDSVTLIGSYAFDSSALKSVVIPESVTTIEIFAIYGCPNLTSVFYQGSVNISTSHVFDYCRNLNLVCVSPEYESTTFSDWIVNSTSNTCKEFQAMFNHCYKGSYKDGQVIAQKRDEAAEWEKQSNHCYEYQCNNKTGQLWAWKRANATEWEDEANDCFVSRQCNNESGRIGSSVCKSDGNVHYVCINNECVDETLNEKQWTVEIEMDDNVRAVEANTAEVLENIAALAGIKKEEVSIGIEVDENGLLIKVILYMDTKETASMVSQAVESIEKGEGCEYGVLCRRRRVIMKGNELSQGTQRIMNHIILLIIMMILLA